MNLKHYFLKWKDQFACNKPYNPLKLLVIPVLLISCEFNSYFFTVNIV